MYIHNIFTMDACFLLLVIILISGSFTSGSKSKISFTIQNNCPYTIWPAAVVKSAESPRLRNTGFVLGQGASSTVVVRSGWMGNFWARTFCKTNSSGDFVCSIGDCGSGQLSCNGNDAAPPVTVVQFSLSGYGNLDFYDVSLINGFNLPVTIEPQRSGCMTTGCTKDINIACPSDLAIRKSNGGDVIGCKSACTAYNTDAYCCRGEFGSAQTCSSSNYSRFFKSRCPQAYSYTFDGSSITCPSGGDYVITFCPSTQPNYIEMMCVL